MASLTVSCQMFNNSSSAHHLNSLQYERMKAEFKLTLPVLKLAKL